LSTHPEFVRGVIRYVKAAGARRILVGDSPGVHLGDFEGPGPGNGFPRSLGLIAASRSTLALDLVASQLIGYDPYSIPTNRHALGVLDGIKSVDDFELKGLSLDEVRPRQFELIGGSQRGPVSRFLMRFRLFRKLETRSRPTPKFDHEKCILCGECIAICASRALSFAAAADGLRYVKLDESKCIRCYCCHEICPVEAISIKEPTCH
jgi:NAD-dependent dihydropyrimidine dehydrogenase PreA subunit